MCGIAGIIGENATAAGTMAMIDAQHHRGPDATGFWHSPDQSCALGHCRLAIIDLSPAGQQPFSDPEDRFCLVFNGEIYNYLELRREMNDIYPFRTKTDTEVLLAAYRHWGAGCLDRLVGMFAFAVWDRQKRRLFAARDRFGVKPFYYSCDSADRLVFASEIKALFAAGVSPEPDATSWASFLVHGTYPQGTATFWKSVRSLPAGACLTCGDSGPPTVRKWYDVADRSGEDLDLRDDRTVAEEYRELLRQSVRLRFRADVPVGINLSGGVDSSVLLGAVHLAQGDQNWVRAFTFTCGDPNYDELPWVRAMLERTSHENVVCELSAEDVPGLADSVQSFQDEPYGGLPTLAYARLFERARELGTIVLLDGQGMDEQWAGYDYYQDAQRAGSFVQGTRDSLVRPDCLVPEFRALAQPLEAPAPYSDRLRNLQYRDIVCTKLPRALRFNDRVSMRASTELREPFLDHRMVELALRQPAERKIRGSVGKWFLRQIASQSLPTRVVEAPKRALQTPQREWLRGPLRDWVVARTEAALRHCGGAWLDGPAVRQELESFFRGQSDNSFYVWQWISMASPFERARAVAT